MRILRSSLVLAAALGAGAGALPVAGTHLAPPRALAADAIDEALAKLDELLKAGDEGKILAFMIELEGKLDARVTAKLAEVARTHKSDRIAIHAMGQAASRKSPDLLKWLKSKVDDDKMLEKHPDRYKAVLRSLARYGDKGTLKGLEDVIKKYLGSNGEIASLALTAYGSVREKPVVDELIKWLTQTENTSGGQSGRALSDATREAYGISKQAILKALEDLTLQSIGDAKTWTEWWEANRKGFVFPDPNAPEVDVTKLTEFTDPAYGWTMKKPEGAFWKFEKQTEDGHRIEANFRDDKNVHWARVRAFVWKAYAEAPTPEAKVKQAVKFWTESTAERKAEFNGFSEGHAPKIETRKIGGKEFWVVTARGIGDGGWKGWEGCERRIYVHQLNTSLLLYIDVVVRSGAEEDVKKAVFGAAEGVTFKK